MNGQSLDIKQNSTAKLRELFPHVFSEDKVDFEKLRATFGNDDAHFAGERYTLNWAGKADAFKTLQERTTATLKPQPELSVNFDTSENVFIEGENLEVLKILQKSYYNKIKCIIIDPPYNTGNDSFIYPDRFKEGLAEYEKRVGERDEAGYLMKEGLFRKNSRESGHYHSNWLSMMMPRLFLARNLLRDDGVIFVHIDDNEVHNLRLVMNEVFGEENFVSTITWEKRYSPQNAVQWFSEAHDFILVYAKLKEIWQPNLLERSEEMNARYRNLDNDPRGDWKPTDASAQAGHGTASQFYELVAPNGQTFQPPTGRCWVYTKDRMQEMIEDNRVWFGSDGKSAPAIKRFLTEVKQGIACQTIWKYEDVGHNQEGKKEIKILFPEVVPFDTPKPTRLEKRILQLCTGSSNDDIVLDFFAGSASTAHAVLELNKQDGGTRKFIMVQLPEPCDASSEAHKAGYKTISDISRERIRRVIQKLEKERSEESAQSNMFRDEHSRVVLDLGFKSFKLSPSNFKVWRSEDITEENLEEQLEAFVDPVKPESQTNDMLTELMLKSGYSLTDKVEDTGDFYRVGGELVIALTKMDSEIASKIISSNPKKAVTLDRLFADNDELKTNTSLQMRDAGVEFRVV